MTNPGPTNPDAEAKARERFRLVESLFREVRRIEDENERRAWLATRCRGAPDLRAEVEAWLGEHETRERGHPHSASSGNPLPRAAWQAIQAEPTPRQIGRYRIAGIIGTGGMGTVYEAEQDEPPRPVALKLLHPELDDGALRRRFRIEAEILARLHHDGIAHVYDFGEVDTQLGPRLFLAMERVHGLPLDAYLASTSLERDDKVRLLLGIADAVSHAHRNGVIHRDLKPSNVLVREDGSPKLLDFGVARRVDDERDLTRTGHLVGTLRYMSPEQSSGSRQVDSRADVFALATIGYEMLAGRHPQDTVGSGVGQAQGEVPRLGAVNRGLRGDLSIIFAKALENRPSDRYGDMDKFAEDLRRYLDSEPIQARPRSAIYQFRKFASRHTAPLIAVALVIGALVAGLALAIRAADREEAQRLRADSKTAQAEQLAYVATIKAAFANLEAGEAQAARFVLESIREARRGWEWEFLHTQLDGSSDQRQLTLWDSAERQADLEVTVELTPDRRIGSVSSKSKDTDRGLGRLDLRDSEGRSLVAPRWPAQTEIVVEATGDRWQRQADVILWYPSGKTEPVRRELGTPLYDLACDAGGRVIAAAGRDKSVRLFDARTGASQWPLLRHRTAVNRVTFGPTPSSLATGDRAGTIFLWNLSRRDAVRGLFGHRSAIHEIRFLPDGSGLVSMCESRVSLWDFQAASALETLRRPATPTGRFIYDIAVRPDGRHVASMSWGQDLEIACRATGARLATLRGVSGGGFPRVHRTRYSPDGRRLATCEHTLHLFDAATGEAQWVSPITDTLVDFAFDPSRDRVLGVGSEGRVLAYELPGGAGTELFRMPSGGRPACIALSPDGSQLAVAARDHVRLFDVKSGKRVWKSQPLKSAIVELAWDPHGRRLAAACSDWVVRLWDMKRGVLAHELRGHQTPVYAVTFSPDGERIASGARAGDVRLWDPDSGLNTLVLWAHADYVHALAYDPSGRDLISGSGDGTVRVWSTRSFKERCFERSELLSARRRLKPRIESFRDLAPQAARSRIEAEIPERDQPAALDSLLLLGTDDADR